jgi:hypothetical protein
MNDDQHQLIFDKYLKLCEEYDRFKYTPKLAEDRMKDDIKSLERIILHLYNSITLNCYPSCEATKNLGCNDMWTLCL